MPLLAEYPITVEVYSASSDIMQITYPYAWFEDIQTLIGDGYILFNLLCDDGKIKTIYINASGT